MEKIMKKRGKSFDIAKSIKKLMNDQKLIEKVAINEIFFK